MLVVYKHCLINTVLDRKSEIELLDKRPRTGYPTDRQIYYPPNFVNLSFSFTISDGFEVSAKWYKDGKLYLLDNQSAQGKTTLIFSRGNVAPGVYQCMFKHRETERIFIPPAFRLDAGKIFMIWGVI